MACRGAAASLVLAAAFAARAQTQMHYWPADANGADAFGTSVATFYGDATYSSEDHALLMSGAGEIDFTPSAGASYPGDLGSANFVVSFSIRTTLQSGPATHRTLLSNRADCGHGRFFDVRLTELGAIYVEVDDWWSGSNFTNFAGTANVADGAWHRVTIVRNGATTTLLVDGKPDGVGTSPAAAPADVSAGAPLRAGNSPCVVGYWAGTIVPFDGALRDITVAAH